MGTACESDPWAFVEPSPDALIVLGPDATILRVNRSFEELFGRARAAVVGQPLDHLLPERHRVGHYDRVVRYIDQPSVRPMCTGRDIRGLCGDGTELPIDISLMPFPTASGMHVVATIRPTLTSATTGKLLATLLELCPDATLVVDESGVLRHANQATVRLFGHALQDMIGKTLDELLPHEVQSRHSEHLRSYFADPRPRPMGTGLELEALHRDGRRIPVEISLNPVITTDGVWVAAALRDVSLRRAAHRELAEASERLSAALEMAQMGVWELDLASDRRVYSAQLLAMLGMSESHADSDAFFGALHEEDRALVAAATARAVREGGAYHLKVRIRRADGGLRWFETSARVVGDGAAQPSRLQGVVRDITDAVQAADTIAESRAQLHAVLGHAPDRILYIDLAGTIRFINHTEPGQVDQPVDSPWRALVPVDMHREFQAAIDEAIERRAPVDVETRSVAGDRWLCNRIGPVIRNSAVVGVVVLSRDITERREIEAQLATADRMATLGMVAASVAHEINNPLAAIVGNVDLLISERLTSSAAREGALADIREAAARIRAIARDLRIFSRVEREEREPIDVVSVVESSLRMAQPEIRHRATVHTDLKPVPPVLASESRLGQVFLNIIVNAAQAIPEGDRDAHQIRVSTGLDAGGRVVVTIADTGCGMAPETVARLFSPFFTTKPAGEGTGLGLTICHRIIHALGGEIAVSSEIGAGSEFSIFLPAARGVPGAHGVSAPPEERRPRRGRVLLIDDEILLTRTLGRVLSADHDVVARNRGCDALELLARDHDFDVILCDLMMPDMTGMSLYSAAIALHPELAPRFVFMTGGAFTDSARAFLANAHCDVLEKPVDVAAMRTLIAARVGDPRLA